MSGAPRPLVARRLGAALQALVLGILLALAIIALLVSAPGTGIFRYEGF